MDTNQTLPVATLAEALAHLRRPVPPDAAHFKVQSEAGNRGLIVAYIDSRTVYERLNQVVGERWSHEFRPLPAELRPASDTDGDAAPVYVICRLTVCGVRHEDVGEGSDPKAAFSDAVKRAAVPFGIGRFLYAMRTPWLEAGQGERQLRRGGRRQRLLVDERTERWLQRQYGAWLKRAGREFGEPLGQGEQTQPLAGDESGVAEATDRGAAVTPIAEHGPESPADGRGELEAQKARGGYSDQTVARLSRLVYGEPARSSPEDHTELVELLGDAEAGGIDDPTLAKAVERCFGHERGPGELLAWISERAARARAA